MSIYFSEGAYRGEIIGQGLSASKNGNPQIVLKIKILESINDPSMQFEQYERTIYWTITDKTIDFIVDKLALIGFDGQSFRQLDPNHANPYSFVGQQEDFYCKIETYEGVEREKWDLSNGGGDIKPLDDSEARKLDAMFGRKLTERFKPSPAKAAKKGSTKPPGLPDNPNGDEVMAKAGAGDDIPF